MLFDIFVKWKTGRRKFYSTAFRQIRTYDVKNNASAVVEKSCSSRMYQNKKYLNEHSTKSSNLGVYNLITANTQFGKKVWLQNARNVDNIIKAGFYLVNVNTMLLTRPKRYESRYLIRLALAMKKQVFLPHVKIFSFLIRGATADKKHTNVFCCFFDANSFTLLNA